MSEFKGTAKKCELINKLSKSGKTATLMVKIGDLELLISQVVRFEEPYDAPFTEEDLANANLIVDAFKVRQQINCELSELLDEYNQLKNWKKEATTVFSQTDFQKIGTLLNIKLGTSISEQLLPKIMELLEHNKEIKEMYKECFELFIPIDKWDKATEFLSTYGNGLAKSLSQKEK